MPTYEYVCESCRLVHSVHHGMDERPAIVCAECDGETEKMISAPSLNVHNYTSPTQAKYARMSESEEIARENVLQKNYRTISLPKGVRHGKIDDDGDD